MILPGWHPPPPSSEVKMIITGIVVFTVILAITSMGEIICMMRHE